MNSKQLELTLRGTRSSCRRRRRNLRLIRARQWFALMHAVVDRSEEWSPRLTGIKSRPSGSRQVEWSFEPGEPVQCQGIK